MKKIIGLLLATALLLSFYGCGKKSEYVLRIEEEIASIGEVTLEKEALISSVESGYQLLSEKDKSKVENIQLLYDARKALSELAQAEEEEEKQKAELEKKKADPKTYLGTWKGANYAFLELTAVGVGNIRGYTDTVGYPITWTLSGGAIQAKFEGPYNTGFSYSFTISDDGEELYGSSPNHSLANTTFRRK